MDLDWLKDFLVLAERRNFSRAADARNVTQPAFSRRIRALEDWIGTPLFVRGAQGATLTPSGVHFRPIAEEMMRVLHRGRRETKAIGEREASLSIAATHALSFTFFPHWIRKHLHFQELGTLNLISDSMEACEEIMLGGEVDFLLCHHHADAPTRFEADQFQSIERRTVHIPDVRSDPEYTFHAAQIDPIRTVLAVPMLKNDELVGVVVIYRLDVRPFSKKQIDLVTTFANQAAIAIENVRLFDEVQARTAEVTEALEYQTATSDVLNVISRSPSEVQAVFDSIVRTARRLCEAERASVLQLEDGKYHAVAIDGVRNPDFDQELAATPIAPDRSSITGRTVLEGRVIHVHDAEADPEFTYLRDHGFEFRRTMLGVPLLRDQRVLGVIVLDRPIVKPFTDKQIELIETFADQAVIAIENARLYQEVQARTRDLTESLQQQTATADVLKVISRSTFDLQTVLDTLVELAARLCDAPHGLIFRFDGTSARAVAAFNNVPGFKELWAGNPILPNRGTATGRAIVEPAIPGEHRLDNHVRPGAHCTERFCRRHGFVCGAADGGDGLTSASEVVDVRLLVVLSPLAKRVEERVLSVWRFLQLPHGYGKVERCEVLTVQVPDQVGCTELDAVPDVKHV